MLLSRISPAGIGTLAYTQLYRPMLILSIAKPIANNQSNVLIPWFDKLTMSGRNSLVLSWSKDRM